MFLIGLLRQHWLEVLGFLTGVSCVLLGIRQIAWNWPVGIAYNIVLFIVLWSHGVYAMALLQILYVGIAFYGWWNWLHGGAGHSTLKVSRTPLPLVALLAVLSAIVAVALHAILHRYTDSTVPWLDSITTTLALAAQYLLSRKLMGTWYIFIVMDAIAIVINLEKHLYPIVALYAFFMILCVAGYREWRKSLSSEQRAPGI